MKKGRFIHTKKDWLELLGPLVLWETKDDRTRVAVFKNGTKVEFKLGVMLDKIDEFNKQPYKKVRDDACVKAFSDKLVDYVPQRTVAKHYDTFQDFVLDQYLESKDE